MKNGLKKVYRKITLSLGEIMVAKYSEIERKYARTFMKHLNQPAVKGHKIWGWKWELKHCCWEGRIKHEEGDGRKGNIEKRHKDKPVKG